MQNPSIKSRFITSIFSNTFRGAMSIATGLVVARGLGPENYGTFVFLLGCFMALRQLLDLGSSRAFYTFISQKSRGKRFVGFYAGWQLAQFVLPLIIIGLLFPGEWLERIWIVKDRVLILVAFAAVFMRENAWNMMVQIGESARLTHRVQLMKLVISAIHFFLVLCIWSFNALSLKFLFGIVVLEYLTALVIAYRVFFVHSMEDQPFERRSVFREYKIYCSPLIIYSLIGFAYEFADRWLLQNFGGSQEQGFYGIAYQCATVSIIATMSILTIFWKEISEAHENQNMQRVGALYRKSSRFLFMTATFISGFLIPWGEDIIRVILGPAYINSVPAFCIMLLYPIHQTLGQVNGAMLFATGETRAHLLIGGFFMIISIPMTYLLLAPKEDWVPGLELGSFGMSLKMVLLQFLNVNVSSWWIARHFGWKFDWLYQIVAMTGGFGIGWVACEAVRWMGAILLINLPVSICIAFLVHAVLMGIFIWILPGIAGLTRDEIKVHFFQSFQFLRIKNHS